MNTIEEMIKSFKENNINDINIQKEDTQESNTFFWPFIESPFFTDIEIEQLKNYYSESSTEESYHKYFNYNESATTITDANKLNTPSYSTKILDLQNQLNSTDDESLKDKIKQSMVDIGWNPEIDYTAASQKAARSRFINLMNEKMCNVNLINISSFIEVYNDKLDSITESIHSSMHPVSIVLVRGDGPLATVIGGF